MRTCWHTYTCTRGPSRISPTVVVCTYMYSHVVQKTAHLLTRNPNTSNSPQKHTYFSHLCIHKMPISPHIQATHSTWVPRWKVIFSGRFLLLLFMTSSYVRKKNCILISVLPKINNRTTANPNLTLTDSQRPPRQRQLTMTLIFLL